jgi:hypothetical protein
MIFTDTIMVFVAEMIISIISTAVFVNGKIISIVVTGVNVIEMIISFTPTAVSIKKAFIFVGETIAFEAENIVSKT